MQVTRLKTHPPTVVALGYFDSVHLGHRVIVDELLLLAKKHNAESVMSTFVGEQSIQVYTLYERAKILKDLKIDWLLEYPSTPEFFSQSAKKFLQSLKTGISPKAIVVGHDFRFGKDRKGDINTLQEFCDGNNIELKIISPYPNAQERVSTSQIKQLIQSGDLTIANGLLGAPFAITDKVVSGNKVATTLGFPTANIRPNLLKLIPKDGVYKTQVTIELGVKKYQAITHVGTKPTFDSNDFIVETHIKDYSGKLYNKQITVEFLNFIRPIQKFNSVGELKAQIQKDLKNL